MFTQLRTCFLGKKYGYTTDTGYRMLLGKGDLKALVKRSNPVMKMGWKIIKATKLVVVGTEPDAEQLQIAADRNIPVMPFEEWAGFLVAANAGTVDGYLRALVGEGYWFGESMNEADDSQTIVTVPVVKASSNDVLSAGDYEAAKRSGFSAKCIDTHWTVADYILRERADYFAKPVTYTHNRDMRSFYQSAGAGDVCWFKRQATLGVADMGPISAKTDKRVLSYSVLDHHLSRFSACVSTRFCLRFSDAPVQDNVYSIVAMGAMEADEQHVTFFTIDTIHT